MWSCNIMGVEDVRDRNDFETSIVNVYCVECSTTVLESLTILQSVHKLETLFVGALNYSNYRILESSGSLNYSNCRILESSNPIKSEYTNCFRMNLAHVIYCSQLQSILNESSKVLWLKPRFRISWQTICHLVTSYLDWLKRYWLTNFLSRVYCLYIQFWKYFNI